MADHQVQHLLDFSGADPLDEFFVEDEKAGPEQVLTSLLYEIAEVGGEITVDQVVAMGYEKHTIALGLQKPKDDGRKKAPLRAHLIGDLRILTLTSQGWQRVGKNGVREAKPNAANIQHRLIPGKMKTHIENTIGKQLKWRETVGVTCETANADITAWQDEVVARAWGDISTRSDAGGEVGMLTRREGCPRPDAIIYEEWHKLLPDHQRPWTGPTDRLWETPVGGNQILLPAVFRVLVEVETSHKSNANLLAKVARLNTTVRLRAADAVLWVTDDESIAARIQKFVERENEGTHAYADIWEMTGDPGQGMPMVLPDRCRPYWLPPIMKRAAALSA